MNKAKRSRPLLLEQLEDRSLLAASMMWFVSPDHDTHRPSELDEPDIVSESFTNRYAGSLEDHRGFDRMMLTGRSSADSNRFANMDLRQDWPSVRVRLERRWS